MRAAVVAKFGAPEVIQFLDLPVPQPADDEVLIRTEAIGINFADVMARLGVYPSIPNPPFVPGIELSGIVDAIGAEVRTPQVGDRVIAFVRQGAYAEYVKTPATYVRRMPEGMTFEEGAAFGVAYLSAYHGLATLAHVGTGERLLFHAAAGGVGLAALQLCRLWGVETFATASADWKLEIAKSHGAQHLINYTASDFEDSVREIIGKETLDVVMDSVGGRLFRKGWRLLGPMGRYILYGFASVTDRKTINKWKAAREFLSVPLIHPPSLVSKNKSLIGFNLYFLTEKVDYLRSVTERLFSMYEAGSIRPVIGATFSFDHIVEAHALLQSRESYGKVIVLMR
jgi:NADPH:quinone reductase-like Zn-dependent oxidoreductase